MDGNSLRRMCIPPPDVVEEEEEGEEKGTPSPSPRPTPTPKKPEPEPNHPFGVELVDGEEAGGVVEDEERDMEGAERSLTTPTNSQLRSPVPLEREYTSWSQASAVSGANNAGVVLVLLGLAMVLGEEVKGANNVGLPFVFGTDVLKVGVVAPQPKSLDILFPAVAGPEPAVVVLVVITTSSSPLFSFSTLSTLSGGAGTSKGTLLGLTLFAFLNFLISASERSIPSLLIASRVPLTYTRLGLELAIGLDVEVEVEVEVEAEVEIEFSRLSPAPPTPTPRLMITNNLSSSALPFTLALLLGGGASCVMVSQRPPPSGCSLQTRA